MSKLLEMKDIHVKVNSTDRGQFSPIKGVSLDIKKKETVGLVGESGCGKSMLLKTCLLYTSDAADE